MMQQVRGRNYRSRPLCMMLLSICTIISIDLVFIWAIILSQKVLARGNLFSIFSTNKYYSLITYIFRDIGEIYKGKYA